MVPNQRTVRLTLSVVFLTWWIDLAIFSQSAQSAEFRFANQTLTVPDGFSVELAAGPPLVDRPITFDFDERGALYVTESSGTNDPVEKQLADQPHRVLRLEDTDADGRFDRRTVFADKLMFPEGSMWFRGSLYVSAPPVIWKLTDTNDDGVADRREEWFNGKTLTGCANDLHGPYRGRDGWIYWCKGAFAEQTHDLPNQPGWKTRASHIFRARPDGTGLESVLTGGMDNPVDVVFTPAGERILSCTFLQHPGGGNRDGLIHAIYGGVYGKDHDVLAGHPRTGELMPALRHLGPAAPCGLHLYESNHLGDEFRGNLFTCQFNLRKVSRHKLLPAGATFTTEDSDFLASDFADFHPTDVMEDADGSLLVCDTGGWYKLCCPTSQFHKPEVLGAIYRIRREQAAKISDPRGLRINWQHTESLPALLGDHRPMVRAQAIERLGTGGTESLHQLQAVLGNRGETTQRLGAVWALARIDAPLARELVRVALDDLEPTVQQAAAHCAGLWQDRKAVPQLVKRLVGSPAAVTRAAAEALGRLGEIAAAEPLLTASRSVDERELEHSLIFALIEIGNPAAIRGSLKATDPRQRRAAMIALSQMPGGELQADEVLHELTAVESPVRDAAWWVARQRPDWGEAIARDLVTQLQNPPATNENRRDLAAAMAELAGSDSIQQLIVGTIDDKSASDPARLVALRAMALSRLSPLPDAWIDSLARAVQTPQLRGDALSTLQSLGLSANHRERLRPTLVNLAAQPETPDAEKLAALETLREQVGGLSSVAFASLTRVLTGELPIDRSIAAGILAQASLDEGQRAALAALIGELGAIEVTRLLPLFADASETEQSGIISALAKSEALGSVRRDVLAAFVAKLPESLRPDGDALIDQIDASHAQRLTRLDALAGSLANGNPDRGRALFNHKKTACSGCHAIGYVGGQTGPDLSRVGQIRTERDLLEAIVYPSASFVRSYEPVMIRTTSGQVFSGILRQETAQELILATGPQTSQRIARDEVEELRPSQTSLMPEGLDKVLNTQELSDLIAYLRACRQ